MLRTPLRVFALILGVLLLVIASAALFLARVDPNDYKARLIAKVHAATGRTLIIDGPLKIAFWPQLQLETGAVQLGNAPGFGDSPMVAVKKVHVAVATWPLLFKRVEMDRVQINGLTVNLGKDADGRTNWEDLAKSDGAESAPNRSARLAAFAVGGVDIQDATVNLQDASTGRELHLNSLNVQSGPLSLGAPVSVKLTTEVNATKPTLDGTFGVESTITYDLAATRYDVKPVQLAATLRGKSLPNGKAELAASSAVTLALEAGRIEISELKITGLDTTLTGTLTIDHLKDERPGARGNVRLEGKDLASLFKALEIPAATQLAALKDRGFDFTTEFNADMDTGVVAVPKFDANLLGATISGVLDGERINTKKPSAKGHLGAKGPDLPTLLIVAAQLRDADSSTSQAIARALAGVKERAFTIDTAFDIDLADARIELPNLNARLLGNELTGTIASRGGAAGNPVFQGQIEAKGPDLTALVVGIGALQGITDGDVAALTTVLGKRKDKSFAFKSTLEADVGAKRIALPALTATLFDNQLKGTFAATDLSSSKPAMKGELSASGPDLPALLAIGSGVSGQPGLGNVAQALAAETDKSFTFDAVFDADLKQGRIELSKLAAAAFGLTLEAAFAAANLDREVGNVDGHITLKGAALGPLLTALGQPALAQSIQSVGVDAVLKGSPQNIALSPFNAVAKIGSGGAVPPVDVRLSAGTAQANLMQETLTIKDLALTGLGMNITGALDATKIKTAPAYSGKLTVPTFNLRDVLAKLNTPVTTLADPTALSKVGFESAFKGSADKLEFSRFRLELDDASIKGDLSVNAFDGPDVAFDLAIDSLNVDRYRAPESTNKSPPITPESAAAGAAQLPIETLRKLKAKGALKIGALRVSHAELANVAIVLDAHDGEITVNPTADLYQGKYNGVIVLNAKSKEPRLTLNTTLAKVAVEPLLKDVVGKSDLSGIVNFEANLSTSGNRTERLVGSLSGPASFAIQNGVFRGVDVPAVLRAAELMIESKSLRPVPTGGETAFQSLTGSLDIKNGVISNKDLLLDGLGFKVTGEGMLANLNDMTIKYDTRISVDQGAVEQNAKRYNLGGYVIPVRCRGPIAGTSCLPDLAELARHAATNAIKDQVKRQLEKKLGGGAGKALKNLLKF